MDTKELKFNNEARESIQNGIDTIANAVRVTLGPKGRNVIIERKSGLPHITKDGVTVAREITLEDKFENLGADIVKSVAVKTNTEAGDGTTTATVLAQSIVKNGLKTINSGVNPIMLKKGIDNAIEFIVSNLKEKSIIIKNDIHKIKQVATISGNNDIKIGNIITKAVTSVGEHGIVNIENGTSVEDILEIVPGLRFDRGFYSTSFINNKKGTVEFEDPIIFMSNEKITKNDEIIPPISIANTNNKQLLIIAEAIEGEAYRTLIMNAKENRVKAAFVKSPAFSDRRKEMMDDIAILTGSSIVDKESGLSLTTFNESHFGSCKKVIITKDNTTIIGGDGDKDIIKNHIEQLKYEAENVKDPDLKVIAEKRLAMVTGSVANIYVGGTSEMEMYERKDRIVDSLNATKAAIQEGIVPGGGVTLLKLSQSLKNLRVKNEDIEKGINIVFKALHAPFGQIIANSGITEEKLSEIALVVIDHPDFNYGHNSLNEMYCNMIDEGIIDPVKVTRTALQNAGSIAGLFLTTECVIAIKEKEEGQSFNLPMM